MTVTCHSGAHGDPHRQEHRGWSVRQRQARRPGAGTRELADPPPPWWPRGGGPRLWRGGQGKPPEAAPAVSRRVALPGRGSTRCGCPGRSRHLLLHLSASAAGSAALPEGRARSMAARPRPAPVIPPLPLHVLWFVSRKMLFESGMVFNKKRATGITKNLGKETYGRHISASRDARYHVPSGTRYSYGPVSAAEVPNADDAKCWGGREAAGRNGHHGRADPRRPGPFGKGLTVSHEAEHALTT